MKVRHRPVLDSGRLQIERHGCTVLQISYETVPGRLQKTTIAVAVISCNTADSGKKKKKQIGSFAAMCVEQE